MFKEVIGFLTIEGWAGVKTIYWLVGVAVFIGIGLVYWFMYREYFHCPKPNKLSFIYHLKKIRLKEWQKLAAKLAAALVVLIILIII